MKSVYWKRVYLAVFNESRAFFWTSFLFSFIVDVQKKLALEFINRQIIPS